MVCVWLKRCWAALAFSWPHRDLRFSPILAALLGCRVLMPAELDLVLHCVGLTHRTEIKANPVVWVCRELPGVQSSS